MKTLVTLLLLLSMNNVWSACDGREVIYSITDPVDQKQFDVQNKLFTVSKSDSFVLILPPIVGETVLDRKMGSRLCANGMNAYIVNAVKVIPFDEEVKDLSIHDNSYVRALAGVRKVIEEIKKQNPDAKIGILGTSLGGMLAAFIAGSEPQISASVIVVGAGNVPGVLSYSEQEIVKAQREARYPIFAVKDKAEYELLLKNLVPNDPINVAQNIAPGSSYLFIANSDITVPTKYQRELRNKIPEPLVFEMNGNHFNGIVKAGTVHASKIVNFFKRKLN